MDDKIDIHNHEKQYDKYKERLEHSDTIIAENRKFILTYLRDSELGKTIKKGQKRKIGSARNIRAAGLLKLMDNEWFKKPFDEISVKEMEEFILRLERGTIKSNRGTAYTSESQMTIKKFFRKYWKWLKGENKFYPSEVEWIDTSGKEADINAVPNLRDGIEKMVEIAPDYLKKAMVMVLFDSGAREGEFLNLRLRDVETLDKEDPTLLIRIRHSKTFPRNVSLPIATPFLKNWLEKHPDRHNKESSLWVTIKKSEYGRHKDRIIPMGKAYFYNNIKRLGEKALGMSVTPHMIRHTSATYYASKLDRASYCRRFGWSFASDMPDRYIDWAKISEKKTAEIIKGDDMIELRKQNRKLGEEMVSLRENYQQLQEDLKSRQVPDDIMKQLTKNPKIMKALAREMHKSGLGNKVV